MCPGLPCSIEAAFQGEFSETASQAEAMLSLMIRSHIVSPLLPFFHQSSLKGQPFEKGGNQIPPFA